MCVLGTNHSEHKEEGTEETEVLYVVLTDASP